MNLVEYRRVSTAGQVKDGYGLPIQARDNRAWAAANGHRIVKVCSDDAVKGALPAAERPGLREAMDALNGKAQGFLVARLDRLAREVTVQEAVLAAIWAGGHRVFTLDGEVLADDPSDPMRTAMRQMQGVFAQLDRGLVVKRLRQGRQAKRADGKHSEGQYGYGYAGAGKGRERDAAPLDSEQDALQVILAMRGHGASYRQICASLERADLKPRRAAAWSAMTVRNICEREARKAR